MKRIFSIIALLFGQKIFAQTLFFKEATIPRPTVTDNRVNDWNNNQSSVNSLSSVEGDFYYWVNYSRANPARFYDSVIVPLVRVYPQLKGSNFESLRRDLTQISSLPLLRLNDTLMRMSKMHSKDIVEHNAGPSHTSTNGKTFSDRFKNFGLHTCGGENISFGAPATDPILMLCLLYLDINVPDLGHRKALLSPNFINTGISASLYKNGNIFLVEDFACSQN